MIETGTREKIWLVCFKQLELDGPLPPPIGTALQICCTESFPASLVASAIEIVFESDDWDGICVFERPYTVEQVRDHVAGGERPISALPGLRMLVVRSDALNDEQEVAR